MALTILLALYIIKEMVNHIDGRVPSDDDVSRDNAGIKTEFLTDFEPGR